MLVKRRKTTDVVPEKEDYEPPVDFSRLVPTGSIYLNCACSDRPHGGFGLGRIVNIIGDSDTGKSILALTCLTSVATVPLFDDYDLFYRDSESADSFDKSKLFKPLLGRLSESDFKPDTVEDFYSDLMSKIASGRKFIYVLDSLDSLTSEAEKKRVLANAKLNIKSNAPGSKKDAPEKKKGSYGTEIPKTMSSLLRVVKQELAKIDSLLVIVSQTRSNIGPSAFFQPKIRSGGEALRFYCTHEIWLGKEKKIKNGNIEIGKYGYAKVTKNKLTGKKRDAFFPIYYDYGIDDIGSCIDFLVDVGYWKLRKQTILAEDLGVEGAKKGIIQHIEKEGQVGKLRRAMGSAWLQREKELELDRKPRFG